MKNFLRRSFLSSSLLRCAPAAIALVPALHAQTVRRVGPGQQYAQITDALADATSGSGVDLILVDPGAYNAFVVDGGFPTDVSIFASSSNFTILPAAGVPEITVRNVNLSSSVTIQGVDISYADDQAPAILIEDIEGAVRLSQIDVTQAADLINVAQQAVVEVRNTDTFWLVDSSIWSSGRNANTIHPEFASGILNDGVSAVRLEDSEGIIQNSRLRGYDNRLAVGGTGYGGDGLRTIGQSTVWLLEDVVGAAYDARFRGGDGDNDPLVAGGYGGHSVHQFNSTFVQGWIQSCGKSDNATTLIYMRGTGDVSGGGYYGWNNTNNSAQIGDLVVFQVVKHCTADDRRNETTIASNLVPLGGTLDVKVRSKLDRDYLVFFSYFTDYTFSIPGVSGRGITNGTSFATLSGTTLGQTVTNLSLPVPVMTSLIGKQIAVQGAFGPPGTSTYNNIGLPALAVIGP